MAAIANIKHHIANTVCPAVSNHVKEQVTVGSLEADTSSSLTRRNDRADFKSRDIFTSTRKLTEQLICRIVFICGKFDTALRLVGSIYCTALVDETGHSVKIGHLCPIYSIRGSDRSADVCAALAATLTSALGATLTATLRTILLCFSRYNSETVVAEDCACAVTAHANCREDLCGQIPSEGVRIGINCNVIYIKRYGIGRSTFQVFCYQF